MINFAIDKQFELIYSEKFRLEETEFMTFRELLMWSRKMEERHEAEKDALEGNSLGGS